LNRPEELRLKLTPPLRLLASFGGDLRGLVYHLGRLVDDGCRALRAGRSLFTLYPCGSLRLLPISGAGSGSAARTLHAVPGADQRRRGCGANRSWVYPRTPNPAGYVGWSTWSSVPDRTEFPWAEKHVS